MLREGERLEPLGGGVRAIVSPEIGFSADSVLLSSFSSPRAGFHLCDLGTGCGIIPLLWCARGGPYEIDAFEINAAAADMARRAFDHNGLSVRVFTEDFRNAGAGFSGRYDLVCANPPYFSSGAARISTRESAALARHELGCTFEDTARCAARMLRNGGRFCLCHRPERLTDVLTVLRKNGMEPKRLRFARHDSGKKPWLVLIEARRGARPGGLEVLPELVAYRGGSLTPEMREIYGDYES